MRSKTSINWVVYILILVLVNISGWEIGRVIQAAAPVAAPKPWSSITQIPKAAYFRPTPAVCASRGDPNADRPANSVWMQCLIDAKAGLVYIGDDCCTPAELFDRYLWTDDPTAFAGKACGVTK